MCHRATGLLLSSRYDEARQTLMKIALYSDLHNECSMTPWNPPASVEAADLVILAGDIGEHTRGLVWASNAFPMTPVVYVAGNHEYYGAHLGLLDELRRTAKLLGIHFLERDTLNLERHGVRILGCTLWSSFDLYGACGPQAQAMLAARQSINDYWVISASGGKRLEPRDTARMHRTAVAWLEAELSKPFEGKTVVLTHFAPHRGCVVPQYEGDTLTPYFVSDLSYLMEKHRIDVWCYGHTHTNTDFVAASGCRVISNQRGYPREIDRTSNRPVSGLEFRDDLLIDL